VASAYSVTKSTGCAYPNNNWEVKWAAGSIPVTYKINQNGTPDCNNEFVATQNAFQAWEDECRSTIDFTYGGVTALGTGSWGVNDGNNIVVWCEANWAATTGQGANTIAINYYWYACADGHLLDSDVILNGENYTWSSSGEAGKMDVQNVMTHECGHTQSLYDLYGGSDTEKTLYGIIANGETKKQSLEQDDRDGVAYLYPSDANERVYIKDADDDYGCPTYNGSIWWCSPDIWLTPLNPVIGQQGTITVRARNMRPSNVQAKVVVEIHDPTVGLGAGQNVLWSSTQNNVTVSPGYTDFVFNWTPAANTFGEGHYCAIATVETADGVTDIVQNISPASDDNVACHNFYTTTQASGSGGASESTVDAGNHTSEMVQAYFFLDRTELPPDWSASIEFPDGTPYAEGTLLTLPPHFVFPMKIVVAPSITAPPGLEGAVHMIGEAIPMAGPPYRMGGVKSRVLVTSLVGVENTPGPPATLVAEAYPNPFNPHVTLAIEAPRAGRLTISVYDASGRLVRRVFDGAVPAGRHESRWDGLDDRGRAVSSGPYFFDARLDGERTGGRFLLLK
jgi:hypothetical protein